MKCDVAKTHEASIFRTGENCWRVARAEKIAFIVDAADYFKTLRKVFISAKRELLLIGWDFDFELDMLKGEDDCDGCAPDGFPNKLGAFIEAVVAKNPDLHVYMLKWNGAILAAPGRLLPALALGLLGTDRIRFALDGHHPFGACHHQKIVVADDTLAFCGGIDATEERWDTSDHLPDDPRRVRKDGSSYDPWHDAASAMTGPVASALAELSRSRWHRATGETLTKPDCNAAPIWPEGLEVNAQGVEVSISRTEPPFDEKPLINEIEQHCLHSIAAARDTIYIESQYFAAETVCDALEKHLIAPQGPEIIVINPNAALSQLEDDAMHVLRARMIERLRAADHQNRFRIYYPATTAGEPIYVHAKIMIVDAAILRLGSSNLNDRSMGFDTECDIAVEGPTELIRKFRSRLLAEHLGVSVAVFDATLRAETTLIATIDRLNPVQGRGLRHIMPRDEGWVGGFLADTRLLDPRYQPGEVTSTGQGVRPRHVAMAAGAAAVVYLGAKLWKNRKSDKIAKM